MLNRTTFLILGVLGFSAATTGRDITSTEREQALRYLAQTREGVIRAVRGLSETQWKFKPASDRWSAAEVLEHIAMTEELVVNSILRRIPEAPPPAAGADAREIDQMILSQVPDRSHKLRAPEELVPKGKWSPNGSLDHFLAAYGEVVSVLASNHDLRGHIIAHPALGPLDGYQWILALAAHTERHTKQILEVEADPHFPSGLRTSNTN